MPPKKQPTQPTDESGGTRVTTRASNANKHPGTEAKKTLQVHSRRDPEVIQADKEKKKAAKNAKDEARQAEIAQRETAKRNLEASRARQAATIEQEDNTFPRQQPTRPTKTAEPAAALVASSTIRGHKRKSDTTPSRSNGDDEPELVAGPKRARTTKNVRSTDPKPLAPQHPAPRGAARALEKVKGSTTSNATRNNLKPQALRQTGLFLHI